jgi:hypothetical protein
MRVFVGAVRTGLVFVIVFDFGPAPIALARPFDGRPARDSILAQAPPPAAPKVLTWRPFRSRAGRFSASFPGTVKSVTQAVNNINNYLVIVENYKKSTFAVSYFDLPSNMQLSLDTSISSYAAGRKGRVASQQRLVLDEFPGREARITLPSGAIARIRVYQVGQRHYQLILEGPRDFVDGAEANQFFDSFKLIV